MARNIEAKLARKIAEANDAYALIEPNDRVMVCVSGGKASWAMLHLLERARRVAPIPFTLFAFHLAQGHPGFPTELLKNHLEAHGFEYVIHAQDTYSIVKEKLKPNQTTCSLCSRLRRGIIYNQAQELGATKIALGHQRDDLIETVTSKYPDAERHFTRINNEQSLYDHHSFVMDRLIDAGIARENIHDTGGDTLAEQDRFFSYRGVLKAGHNHFGGNASAIALRG